jgi:exonuclease III
MNILSWNSCGLGMMRKRRRITKLITEYQIDICFLLETKLANCSIGFVSRIWNENHVSWSSNDAQGSKGGLLAMWKNTNFEVSNIEYGHGWIGLYGKHVHSDFHCFVIGIHAPCNYQDRQKLWDDLILLKHAFEVPWIIAGDFNETLSQKDRNSGICHPACCYPIFDPCFNKFSEKFKNSEKH